MTTSRTPPPADSRSARRIRGKKAFAQAGLAVLAALFLLAGFPPFALWPLPWIALAPLYIAIADQDRPWSAFRTAWIFGVTLFLVDAYWMLELGTVPWAMLAFIEAVPFGLQALFCCVLLPRVHPSRRPIVFAGVWVIGEWFRSCGRLAFPWFLLAASQVRAPLPELQILSVTGQWGLSFLIALTGALIGEAYCISRRKATSEHRLPARLVICSAAIPLLVVAGGAIRLALLADPAAGSNRITIAAAQGNVPKEDIHSDTFEAYQTATMDIYDGLTTTTANGIEKPDLIVWPETVVQGYLLHDRSLYRNVSELARATKTSLLVGTVDIDSVDPTLDLNTAVLFDSLGIQRDRYDKVQVVPIGEYFPFRSVLGPIYKQYGVPDRDFTSGTRPGILKITETASGETARVGSLICYDDVFPWQPRERVRGGAQVLVLTTSDQTFGTTSGPQQHADLDVLRAVETGRYMLRAAATGPSEVVRPDGGIEALLPIDRRGVLQRSLPLLSGQTIFVRLGDWVVWACFAIVVLVTVAARRRARA